MRGSEIVQLIISKMKDLVEGKYFNNKEVVVEGYVTLVKTAGLFSNQDFSKNFIGETCFKQIEKNLTQRLLYKNTILKVMQ